MAPLMKLFWGGVLLAILGVAALFVGVRYDSTLVYCMSPIAFLASAIAFMIIGILYSEFKLRRRWRKHVPENHSRIGDNKFNPRWNRTCCFPINDIERLRLRGWAYDILRELSIELTSAMDARDREKARLDEVTQEMQKALQTYRDVTLNDNKAQPHDLPPNRRYRNDEQLRHDSKLAMLKCEHEKARRTADRANRRYCDLWNLFGDLTIGEGKSIPKNMLPVKEKMGDHWQSPDAFRRFDPSIDHQSGHEYEFKWKPPADPIPRGVPITHRNEPLIPEPWEAEKRNTPQPKDPLEPAPPYYEPDPIVKCNAPKPISCGVPLMRPDRKHKDSTECTKGLPPNPPPRPTPRPKEPYVPKPLISEPEMSPPDTKRPVMPLPEDPYVLKPLISEPDMLDKDSHGKPRK